MRVSKERGHKDHTEELTQILTNLGHQNSNNTCAALLGLSFSEFGKWVSIPCDKKFYAAYLCYSDTAEWFKADLYRQIKNDIALKNKLSSGPIMDSLNNGAVVSLSEYFCQTNWIYLSHFNQCFHLYRTSIDLHDNLLQCEGKGKPFQSYNKSTIAEFMQLEPDYIFNELNIFTRTLSEYVHLGCLAAFTQNWQLFLVKQNSQDKDWDTKDMWTQASAWSECDSTISIVCTIEPQLSNKTEALDNVYFQCNNGNFILKSLVCNMLDDCGDESDEAVTCTALCQINRGYSKDDNMTKSFCTEKCHPDNCTCAAYLFQCHSGGCISSVSLCNGYSDCSDQSDERFCTAKSRVPDFQHLEYAEKVSNLANIPCWTNSVHADDRFRQDQLCVLEYKTSKQELLCPDGSNLRACPYIALEDEKVVRRYDMMCSDKYMCRKTMSTPAYCLPLHYVCDGNLDCPEGDDEENCYNIQCPKMLKCQISQVCVHSKYICDGEPQCPLADDEMVCVKCPPGCECHDYSIVCTDAIPYDIESIPLVKNMMLMNITSRPNRYVRNGTKVLVDLHSVVIRYCFSMNMLADFFYLTDLFSPRIKNLDLSHNNITEATINTPRPFLKVLILNNNSVQDIRPGAMAFLVNVEVLQLKYCNLKDIPPFTFQGLISTKQLDLSYNQLTSIKDKAFTGLQALQYLYLHGNPITHLGLTLLSHVNNFVVIYLPNLKPCCVLSAIQCIAKDGHKEAIFTPSYSKICLFYTSKTIKMLSWLNSVSLFILSVSIVTFVYFKTHSGKRDIHLKMYNGQVSVYHTIFTANMITLNVAENYYGVRFFNLHLNFHRICNILQITSLISMLLPLFLTCGQSISLFISLIAPFSVTNDLRRRNHMLTGTCWILASAIIILLNFNKTYPKDFCNTIDIVFLRQHSGHFVSIFAIPTITMGAIFIMNMVMVTAFITAKLSQGKTGSQKSVNKGKRQAFVHMVLTNVCYTSSWLAILILMFSTEVSITQSSTILQVVFACILPCHCWANTLICVRDIYIHRIKDSTKARDRANDKAVQRTVKVMLSNSNK